MMRTQSANASSQTHTFAQLLEMKEQAPDGYQFNNGYQETGYQSSATFVPATALQRCHPFAME
jgi:hypothetical protein